MRKLLITGGVVALMAMIGGYPTDSQADVEKQQFNTLYQQTGFSVYFGPSYPVYRYPRHYYRHHHYPRYRYYYPRPYYYEYRPYYSYRYYYPYPERYHFYYRY